MTPPEIKIGQIIEVNLWVKPEYKKIFVKSLTNVEIKEDYYSFTFRYQGNIKTAYWDGVKWCAK